MSLTHSAILLGIQAFSLALVACGQPMTESGGFTELQRAMVTDANDLEVVMGLIERSGESSSAKHFHPGGEFGFVLEGAVTVATDGNPEETLEAGASFYQPPGEWHIVGTTADGARTVVFRVLKKGQPMIVAVE
jgi:quercetin dioxygenase-like cupin family protein